MSTRYVAVGWNRQKKIYDGLILAGILFYLSLFIMLNHLLQPNAPVETVLIRAFGTAAILLLHLILSIGPLCRIDKRFLPLLYNRRHLGVSMFLLALAHGTLALILYHGFSDMNPFVSLFVSNADYGSLSGFPFQTLGFLALIILFLMAATSHDFWLANLTPPIWKALHMSVYAAYGLLIGHVMLGTLQTETRSSNAAMLGLGMVWLITLHLTAAFREFKKDRHGLSGSDFVEVCDLGDIAEKKARIFLVSDERIAIFKYDGKLSAVSNVCKHQNGPLGEGRIVDGCITCPWHGYQYKPASGASPPPFKEKVPTFRLKLVGSRIWVDPRPNPPGTHIDPVVFSTDPGAQEEE